MKFPHFVTDKLTLTIKSKDFRVTRMAKSKLAKFYKIRVNFWGVKIWVLWTNQSSKITKTYILTFVMISTYNFEQFSYFYLKKLCACMTKYKAHFNQRHEITLLNVGKRVGVYFFFLLFRIEKNHLPANTVWKTENFTLTGRIFREIN